MKITARELKELGIIERVIREEEPVTRETLPQIKEIMDQAMVEFMENWKDVDGDTIASKRYDRFRTF